MRVAVVLAGLLAAAAVAATAVAAETPERSVGPAPGLPPPECVRAVRAARIAQAGGNVEKARAALREAVEKYPGELIPLVAWFRLERMSGVGPEQAIELRKTLFAKLDDPAATLAPGVVEYLLEGVGKDADELIPMRNALSRRVAQRGDDPAMLRALARVHDRLGEKEEAYVVWGRVHAVDPTSNSFWTLVNREIHAERWASLRQRLEPRIDDASMPISFRLAYLRSLAELGDFDELERRLATIAPRHRLELEALNELRLGAAWTARDAGNDERAKNMFEAVVSTQPKHPVATAAVKYLYGPQDAPAAGESGPAAYGEMAPQAALEKGAGLLAAGDYAGALPLLRTAALGMSDSEAAWFNLGLAALKAEKFVEAEEALARSSRLNPRRPDSYFNRGAALTQLKRHEEAIGVLNKVLELEPSMKAAHYYLYQCYLGLGNREAAGRHLQIYQAP